MIANPTTILSIFLLYYMIFCRNSFKLIELMGDIIIFFFAKYIACPSKTEIYIIAICRVGKTTFQYKSFIGTFQLSKFFIK